MSTIDRREFLGSCVAAGATAAVTSQVMASQAVAKEEQKPLKRPPVGVFTKSFQDRPIDEVCRIFRKMGLDGLDLTVRPGGHIEPKDVQEKLPAAVKAAKDADMEILFLTTGITTPDATAERLMATAAEQGITRIKLGYYRYTEFGTLAKQLKDVRRQLAAVAKLGTKHGVLPCVHVHSGPFLPSHGTQLYQVIRDFSPEEVGAYVDPLHMTVEGARDGWRQGLDLLAPWIRLCSVKNFAFERGARDERGTLRWNIRNVPVADGIAPIPEFVAALKTLGFNGPYSLHSEYKGRHSFKSLDTDGCIRQTAADWKYFRELL
jgi:sugar phosphate isomerase/epimerase